MRYTASAPARPRSDSTQFLNCIADIVLPNGYNNNFPHGKFPNGSVLGNHHGVKTIDETRRARLEMLIKNHGGKLANLNEALGFERTHSQLARIRNRNARTDRPGKFYAMGDEQAREIEQKLGLETGWMDTPPSYAEIHGESDPRAMAMQVFESLPTEEWATALRLLAALAEPGKNGTHN